MLDIDVQSYFDSIDWELLLRAVRHHTDCPWVRLYIERWLKAPVQMEDGSVVPRTAGTPQGGVVSPILSKLFLHYVFDAWMARGHPGIPFERYADDIICHCRSAEEARALWSDLEVRFAACGLVLHPRKTKLVYCKDVNRRGNFPNPSFDFLGYTFRPRKSVWHGHQHVVSFLPAVSPKALKAIGQTIRRWALHRRSDKALDDLAQLYNPYIQGWINYFRHFYGSRLHPTLRRIDAYLIRWARRNAGSSSVCAGGPRVRETGWHGFAVPIPLSSPTGVSCLSAAEHREPCESRGSRTVLGARGGEVPPRDSTICDIDGTSTDAGSASVSAGSGPRSPFPLLLEQRTKQTGKRSWALNFRYLGFSGHRQWRPRST